MSRNDPNVNALRDKLVRATGWTPIIGTLASSLYSQRLQRDLYEYQRSAYERQLADWNKYVGQPQKKTIQYPELSYEGHIRSLDTGISQSYANSFGSLSRFTGGSLLGSSRSFYSNRSGRGLYSPTYHSSRYL